MGIVARMDDLGRPAWIAFMILGFIFFWPIGLATLAFLIWSRRMGCWGYAGHGRWYGDRYDRRAERMQEKMSRMQEKMERWCGGGRSSGNHAFDEYRAETLRRLEEEQREFRDFLDRLRFAKDKAEFDEFLADRRRRRETPEPPTEPPPQG